MTIKSILLFIGICSFIQLSAQSWQYYDSISKDWYKRKNMDSALYYNRQSLQVTGKIAGMEDTVYANLLRSAGDINYRLGRYDQCILDFQQESDIRKRVQGAEHPDYAEAINSLGYFYQQVGRLSEAEPMFLQSLEIRKKAFGEDDAKYRRYLANLAAFYLATDNYYNAEAILTGVIQWQKEKLGSESNDYVLSLNNLSALYNMIGNYPKAEKLIKEVAAIRRKTLGENHISYANTLNNIAQLCSNIASFSNDEIVVKAKNKEADSLYCLAYNIWQQQTSLASPYYANLLNNMAIIKQKLNDYSSAEKYFKESIIKWEQNFGPDHPEYARVHNNFGAFYAAIAEEKTDDDEKLKHFQKADSLYSIANKAWRKVLGENHSDYILNLNKLAHLYFRMGMTLPLSKEEQMVFFKRSADYYRECLDKLSLMNNQNFAFMSEKEKEMYQHIKKNYYLTFYYFAIMYQQQDPSFTGLVYNNVLRNKGFLLKSSATMRKIIAGSGDTLLLSKYQLWMDKKKELSRLNALPLNDQGTKCEILESEANELEKDLVKSSHTFSRYYEFQNTTWEKVQAHLKSGEAAIEFLRFKTQGDTIRYCALVLKPGDAFPKMISLCREDEIVALFHNDIRDPQKSVEAIYGTKDESDHSLYRLIWEPLLPALANVKTIYYAPDGFLHKVAFASITDIKKKYSYLGREYFLNRVTTTERVIQESDHEFLKTERMVLIGGIEYSDENTEQEIWPFLQGTLKEVNTINEIFQGRQFNTLCLTGNQATEESIKTLRPDFGILHIATHGFFYPDPSSTMIAKNESEEANIRFRGSPGFGNMMFAGNKNPLMRTGLVLSAANNVWNSSYEMKGEDGVLTALEVTQMNLSSTGLVVLSACETGLGDISGSEGVYGLQRAFKIAGASFIIMSLWQVPDKETVEFMTIFYEKLVKNNNTRTSFHETQKVMQKKYDPFFWAAFELVE